MKPIFFSILLLIAGPLMGQVVVSGSDDNDIIGRICRMPNGAIAAIIERNSDWQSGDLYISFSDDDGATWSSLSPVVVESANQSTFSLVCHGDSLHVYYASDEDGAYAIYHIASVNGIDWRMKHKVDLGWDVNDSYYDPSVYANQEDGFCMIYKKIGGGLYVTKSLDGNTWDIDRVQVNESGFRPRICKGDDIYLAVYHQNVSGAYNVYCKTTTDFVNWSNPVQLTSNGNSHDPFCAWNGNIYMVFYSKAIDGIYQLYFRKSANLTSWDEEQEHIGSSTHNTQSCLFFEDDYLYLMWTHAIDYDTNNDIMFQRIKDVWTNINMNTGNNQRIFYSYPNSTLVFEGFEGKTITMISYDLMGKRLSTNCIKISSSNHTIQYKQNIPSIVKIISDNKSFSLKVW